MLLLLLVDIQIVCNHLMCGVIGSVQRRCIKDSLWEEFIVCFREETKRLLDQVIDYLLIH